MRFKYKEIKDDSSCCCKQFSEQCKLFSHEKMFSLDQQIKEKREKCVTLDNETPTNAIQQSYRLEKRRFNWNHRSVERKAKII